jgi:hypothetical protein
MARFVRKILNPKEVTRRLKGRGKSPSKQSGTPGGNIPQKSNKKPTSKPIDDEKGRGRGKFQKGSAPAPQNQNVSTRVEDDAADFVNKGGAGKVESRGGRMVRGTVGDGNKSSSEAGKEKARLSKFIRESDDKEAVKKAKRKLAQMNRNDEVATDKARSSAAKTRRATAEKNRGKIKDPAGHFMQTGEIVEGFNPTPNQIKKANMNAGRRKAMPKKGGGYMKKKMSVGGPLKMVEKNGKKVPFYAADGVGKMSKGGKVSKSMGEDRTSVPKSLSAKAQSKKPVKKKMGGGKVYKRKYGGKTVSANDGDSFVAAYYD